MWLQTRGSWIERLILLVDNQEVLKGLVFGPEANCHD